MDKKLIKQEFRDGIIAEFTRANFHPINTKEILYECEGIIEKFMEEMSEAFMGDVVEVIDNYPYVYAINDDKMLIKEKLDTLVKNIQISEMNSIEKLFNNIVQI